MKTLVKSLIVIAAAATVATSAAACPNLRVTTTVVPVNGIDHILADVRNIGAHNYISAPGLQRVVLSVTGQPIHSINFTNVPAGGGGVWHVPLPADDYANHIRVEIVYDPAVLTDANPWNNDCVAADNVSYLRLEG